MYFATKLVDYDPSVNNNSWQWSFGSGVDAQPYFRIFNPWAQALKIDKDCAYIKKWIPALENVPAKDIHNWYKPEIYTKYLNDGIKYYKPIIDYKTERLKCLELFKEGLSN
jgi:deoxyribodipyrimidine photo-lyase